ncbi:MAG: hypothetical protein ACRDYY_07710 [Acidimicrobiales bacterium]
MGDIPLPRRTPSVDTLLSEAAWAATSGWDFSWLGDRMLVSGPAWDFAAVVDDAMLRAARMLDLGLGTGGGSSWDRDLACRLARWR